MIKGLQCHFQIGDLKGLFGLLMVNVQMLRAKLGVLDVSYGTGTGNFIQNACLNAKYLVGFCALDKFIPNFQSNED